jgi:macrolide-specific efflux system membrane fusion protein
MATRTQASISVLLAVGTSVLAGVAAYGAVSVSQTQYAGVVTAASVTPLNFQSSGYVENVVVRPGQLVTQGQVLATQNTVQARAQLAAAQASAANDQLIETADQAAVTADQSRVGGELSPQVQSAQSQQDQLQVTKAQDQVAQAQQQATASATVDQQNIDQVNAIVQSDQSKLSADTSTYSEQCQTSPPTSYTQVQCDALKAQMTADQSTLTGQQGLAASVRAQATQTAAQDAGAVSQAQISLQMAQGLESVQSAPAASATVADAQAAMARDQAQVERDKATSSKDQETVQADQLALYQLAVTAPFNAIVLAVNGQVGTLADQAGVRLYGDTTATSAGQQDTGLFSLLPPTPQAGGTAPAANSQLPLIEIRAANGWTVTSRVPETSLSQFTPGRRATVSIPSAGVTTVKGVVSAIDPLPVVAGGSTGYNVVVRVTGALPASVLSGMSADVALR